MKESIILSSKGLGTIGEQSWIFGGEVRTNNLRREGAVLRKRGCTAGLGTQSHRTFF